MKVNLQYSGTLGRVLFDLYRDNSLFGSLEKPKELIYETCLDIINKIGPYEDFDEFKKYFEQDLDGPLKKLNFIHDNRKKTRETNPTMIFPNSDYRVDFVNLESPRIGIEVEKAERRFVLRQLAKLIKAMHWENKILDFGILIIPERSQKKKTKFASASMNEINNFLVPLLSQYHMSIIKTKIGIITVKWDEN